MSSARVSTLGAMALVALLVPGAVLAQTGVVTGRVTAADTQQPIANVSVLVTGTNRSGVTDREGRFRITGVPAGRYAVRASMIGYSQGDGTVTVTAGGTATVDLTLAPAAVELGGIIVNAVTGQVQAKREVANSVGTINVDDIELGPVTSIGQLVNGRVAGAVAIQTSGVTGSGSRIRIRGNNSISLSNAPLIVVDGVRVEGAEKSLGFDVGGQAPSRLDDLNPEDIETIDILKGPAATAIYGTAAANGVIVVTTRVGRPGAPRFAIWSELGELEQRTDFPDNVYVLGNLVGGAGTGVPPGVQGRCDIFRLAVGANPGPGQIGCTSAVETFRFNPLENDATTPLRKGKRETVGGSISGGSEATRFYLSLDYDQEKGVLPENHVRRVRMQANLDGQLSDKVNASAHFGYLQNDAQLPLGDNASFGIFPMGLYGDPRPDFVEAQMGFESDPAFFYDWKTFQDFSRFTGSLRADYRPFSWLTLNGLAGLDRYARNEFNRIPRVNAYNIFGSVFTEGFIQDFDYDISDVTTNASGTAVFNLGPELASTSSVGVSYLREDFNQVYAFGATLTPGIEESLAGTNTDFEVDEDNVLNSTVGAFAQQQFAWRDRLFVNAALRGDKNTAFGTDIGWIWYPGVSAAWLISDEDFFSRPDWLDDLRLRAAFGQSGLRPGATDALQSFSSTIGVFQNASVPAIIINEIGNADLKPERSTEWEGGFDVGLLSGRAGAEVTYFHKTSKDALVNKPLPPSLGSSANRFENLAEVRNSGLEVQLNLEPYRNGDVRWHVGLGGSFLSNELVDLGKDAQGNDIPPILGGFAGEIRRTEGYPLFSFFHPEIVSFDDADGNGLLDPSELVVADDTVAFLGTPFPKREFTVNTAVTFRDWLRVSALMDYKGGHKQMNVTRLFRCLFAINCEERFDPDTPLEQQAELLAYQLYGTFSGFVEDASFLKLREVAVTFIVPGEWAQRVSAQRLSITLAGRNLKTWTDYTGLDPEVAWNGASNTISGDFGTIPPNRYIALRLDAIF